MRKNKLNEYAESICNQICGLYDWWNYEDTKIIQVLSYEVCLFIKREKLKLSMNKRMELISVLFQKCKSIERTGSDSYCCPTCGTPFKRVCSKGKEIKDTLQQCDTDCDFILVCGNAHIEHNHEN